LKTLKIHTLTKGYWDKDEVLLHSSFQLLVGFVEKEKPDQIIDWNFRPDTKLAWKEIKSLYRWWKNQRPMRVDPLDDENLKRPPFIFEPCSDNSACSKLKEFDKRDFKKYTKAIDISIKN